MHVECEGATARERHSDTDITDVRLSHHRQHPGKLMHRTVELLRLVEKAKPKMLNVWNRYCSYAESYDTTSQKTE